ncbi:MAG: lipopolysaccharide kinase InaA family protein [Campylobacterota bacterium]|nr:lipopolysaccharide kinase InaA family protein [Campylobacterota bacterium]
MDKKYVVKSFKIPHLLNKIVYRFFRESKAKRSYDNSVKLLKLGINTPKPIAYIEYYSSIFFTESFYISEFFDYDFEIREVFSDLNYPNRKNILKKFIEFSYQLHEKGVFHIDYSPGNILIKKEDGEYLFYIIDVNRMKFLPLDNALRMKSLSKLTKNKDDNDYMLRHYTLVSNINEILLREKFDFYLKEEIKYLKNKKKLKKLRGR